MQGFDGAVGSEFYWWLESEDYQVRLDFQDPNYCPLGEAISLMINSPLSQTVHYAAWGPSLDRHGEQNPCLHGSLVDHAVQGTRSGRRPYA
jgi:hypothetical protein